MILGCFMAGWWGENLELLGFWGDDKATPKRKPPTMK